MLPHGCGTTLSAVSYLLKATICSPRNVVNETVKARETPANWNTRFFHGVLRNRGESGVERSVVLPDALRSADPLSRFYPYSSSLPAILFGVCRSSHRLSPINRDFTLPFQPVCHFALFYKIPPSRIIAYLYVTTGVSARYMQFDILNSLGRGWKRVKIMTPATQALIGSYSIQTAVKELVIEFLKH